MIGMLNPEKLLKDLNLQYARFGDSEVVSARSLLPYSIPPSDAHRLYLEIARKLGFRIE